MKRALVIGCPGGGKSEFARRLASMTGLPLVRLDMLYWNPDRTTVDREIFRERLGEALQGDEWIIDGNYISTMDIRLARCDTVFFLDYDKDVCLSGVRARRGKPRSDMPWIEESDDEEFISYIENFSRDVRPRIIELFDRSKDCEINIFHTRAEADEFLIQLERVCKIDGK